MRKHARFQLDNIPGVLVIEGSQTFLINWWDRWVMKLKKLNHDFSTSNIQTQQVMLFNGQQLEMPTLEQPTNVYLGYTLNKTKSGAKGIHLVCPNSSRTYWAWHLSSDEPMTLSASIEVGVGDAIAERRLKLKPEAASAMRNAMSHE